MDIDWAHTALGGAIHVASAFFWAAVAFVAISLTGKWSRSAVWLISLGTTLVAAIVDYGLMPSQLTPGWELVLSPPEIAAGLFALGVGIGAGLHIALSLAQSAPRSPETESLETDHL